MLKLASKAFLFINSPVIRLKREGEVLMTSTVIELRSGVAATQIDPQHQVDAFLKRARLHKRQIKPGTIPKPPSFTPKTETEVLLLHEVRPRQVGLTPTVRTVKELWRDAPAGKSLDLEVTSLEDTSRLEPDPKLAWVAFDPCKLVTDEDGDFKASVYIGRDDRSGFYPFPYARIGSQRIDELAGLEVFTALVSMPEVIRRVCDSTFGLIVPRLSGRDLSPRAYEGVLHVDWSGHRGGPRCYTQSWDYNYYGHSFAIPGVRRLDVVS